MVVITNRPSQIEPDPEYDFVAASPAVKKGRQCGKCGMKFDYNISYGYWCMNSGCPMGYGGSSTVIGL